MGKAFDWVVILALIVSGMISMFSMRNLPYNPYGLIPTTALVICASQWVSAVGAAGTGIFLLVEKLQKNNQPTEEK